MVTRKKSTGVEWSAIGESHEMPNGVIAQLWTNNVNGEKRYCPVGIHPTEQPNAMPLVAVDYDETPDDDEPIEETATDRVAAMMRVADGQDRAQIKVYRMVQGQMEYCQGFAPTEFEEGNFDMIRDRFGAGEYMLRLYATNPTTNKFAVRASTRIKIAESKLPLGGSNNELPNGLSQLLSTIAQGQQQMLSALVEIKQTPPKDAMEDMTKMLSMMTMMREAMGLNGNTQKSSIGEIVGAIRELRGAAEEIVPNKNDEPDGLIGMLPKVLDMVSAGQQQQLAMQQNFAPVEIPPAIANTPIAETPNNQQSGQNNMNVLALLKLKSYLKTLLDMAVANKTANEGASFIYDKLPDELIEILFLDNWFELLSNVAPEVVPHKEWLSNARDIALTMFEPVEDSTINETTTPAN